MKGYEYEVVGYCERSGKPKVAPKFWAYLKHSPRPVYPTCACCKRVRKGD